MNFSNIIRSQKDDNWYDTNACKQWQMHYTRIFMKLLFIFSLIRFNKYF